MIPDCNDCANLVMTEEKQNVLKKIEGKYYDHFCKKYQRRVKHNNPPNVLPKYHSPFLNPCNECYKDNYESFEKREE